MRPAQFFVPLAALVILSGCGVTIQNLTPNKVPQNPSGIYTISMGTDIRDASVVRDSMQASIVIDGTTFPMERNPFDPTVFDFDYIMPEDQSEAAFYFILDYEIVSHGFARPRRITSGLENFQLVNKYVIQMQVSRSPVGRTIPVLGRQFSRTDRILIGGIEAETRYKSENEIEFVVPALPAGESYFVQLRSGDRTIPVGNFMVDPSVLKVAPTSLTMRSGETRMLVFSVDFEAPSGGLPIEITTDIPASIIMPEVVIPAGSRSVNVPVQGGVPAYGTLFAKVPGMKDLTIPVTIQETRSSEI